MATDCKSVSASSRWFESNPLHIRRTLRIRNTLYKKKFFCESLRYLKFRYVRVFLRKCVLAHKFLTYKRYTRITIYKRTSRLFYHAIIYNAYQGCFWWLKTKFNSVKYHAHMTIIRENTIEVRYWWPYKFLFFFTARLQLIWQNLRIYSYFFLIIYIDLGFFKQLFLGRRLRVRHTLLLAFRQTRLLVHLQKFNKINYFALAPGLFIRFFEKKKALKKSKILWLFMMRHVRKMLLIGKLRLIDVCVRQTPVFLPDVISALSSPVTRKFIDPITKQLIDETKTRRAGFKILYFTFEAGSCHVANRGSRKGRIKRKVLRRLVFKNKIID